ncbi:MAG: ATP-binding protein [Gracilibacteraceae bacterium]|jgi:hypothetical protein|nr:ATP-binding protein [Gracilibacteraceae bacterium]
MADFNARRVIEALRSGVASREAGRCFSSARPRLLRTLDDALEEVAETRTSSAMVISGKYGEGKTHLLNTLIGMAAEKNMVVSLVTLSKETPLDKMHLLYQKIVQGTYWPGHAQPGFTHVLRNMTTGHPITAALYEYVLTTLGTDKLYYLLKSYFGSGDEEEKFLLLADIEGDFINNSTLKSIFRRIYNEPVAFRTLFLKTRHVPDYLAFLSHLFLEAGCRGWVILFDETELVGRMGKNARLKAYANMARFLHPERMEAVYSVFALNSSYIPDVVEGKNEFINLENAGLDAETHDAAAQALNAVIAAPQLTPLGQTEILEIMRQILGFHAAAYDWSPALTGEELLAAGEKRGYLLRTKIRAAIELMDQFYQYGKAGSIRVNELGQATFEEQDFSFAELPE